MNFKSAAALVVVATAAYTFLVGNPIEKAKEIVFPNTVTAIDACMKLNSSEVLGNQAVKLFCTSKHQAFSVDASIGVNGKALVNLEGLKGNLTNETSNFVITNVIFDVVTYDAEGEKLRHELSANTWLPPNSQTDFFAKFAKELDRADLPETWCDHDLEEEKLKSCKSWGVKRVLAVKL